MGLFATVLPSIVAGAANLFGGAHQAKEMSRIADRQMAFQETMSNSAYQRSVADMRLAGINPIFAAGGGGASSPSGASFSPPNVMEGGINSALDLARSMKELKEVDSRIGVNDSLKSLQDVQRKSITATARNLEDSNPVIKEKSKFEGAIYGFFNKLFSGIRSGAKYISAPGADERMRQGKW